MRRVCKWGILLCLSSASLVQTSHATPALFGLAQGANHGLQTHRPGPDKQNDLAIKSPQQAMQRVRSQFHAKVLTIQSSQVNGNPGYRVKLLTQEGEVFYVLVDARTGAVIRN